MDFTFHESVRLKIAFCRSSQDRTLGFSLLEMMIVLAIMAGMMVMVWPNIQGSLRKAGLNEAAATLRTVINDARYQAMLQGQCWTIRLDPGQGHLLSGSLADFAEHMEPGFTSATQNAIGLESSSLPEFQGNTANSTGMASQSRQPSLHQLPNQILITDFTRSTSFPVAETNDLDIQAAEPVLGQEPWWILLSASGTGEDCSVCLKDSSTGQSIWVVYFSATGSIETFP